MMSWMLRSGKTNSIMMSNGMQVKSAEGLRPQKSDSGENLRIACMMSGVEAGLDESSLITAEKEGITLLENPPDPPT